MQYQSTEPFGDLSTPPRFLMETHTAGESQLRVQTVGWVPSTALHSHPCGHKTVASTASVAWACLLLVYGDTFNTGQITPQWLPLPALLL